MQKLLKDNFNNIINNAKKVSQDTHLMYHPKRRQLNYSASESYDGLLNCGPMCLAVYKLLSDNNINCQVYKSSIGYGSYLQDHVYININDQLIDPTYKQFLRDTRGINDKYQRYIYNELDSFFIGNINELIKTFKKSKLINSQVYIDYNIVDMDNINDFWLNPIDITNKFKNNIHLLN